MRKIFSFFIILGSLFLITSCVAATESKTIHRVTFDPDNGAEQFYVEVEDGMTVDVPTDPEKEDHQFLGWYKEGKLFDFATQITQSINLIATYEQIVFHYNVEFYDTGDSNIKNQTVRHNERVKEPSKPTRDGYIFLGWYLEDGSLFDFNNFLTSDIKLYAKWEEVSKTPEIKYYTVMLVPNNGDAPTELRVQEGTTLVDVENPTMDKHEFLGWKDSNDVLWPMGNPIYKDITLYGSWKKEEVYYTVTFDTDGGSLIESIKVLEGTHITDIPNPTKENYLFNYGTLNGAMWDFASDVVEDNITLKASWELDKSDWVYITFNSFGDVVKQIHQPKGLFIDNFIPEKDGYDFVGWQYESEFWDFGSNVVNENISLSAVWKKFYIIEFEVTGGKQVADLIVYEDEAYTLPTATKDGYMFDCWLYNGTPYYGNLALTSNIVLTAKWKKVCTVTFETDGKPIEPVKIVEGEWLNLNTNPIFMSLKDGYYFNGWLYNGEIANDVEVTEDITFVADYKEIEFDSSLLVDWEYYLYMNKVIVTKYIGTDTEIVMPSIIDVLKGDVFNESSISDEITKIVVNPELTDFGAGVFNNLPSLKHFEFIDAKVDLEYMNNNPSLEKLIVGDIESLAWRGITGFDKLSYIKLTNAVEISYHHFEGLKALKTVIISDKTERINQTYIDYGIELDYLEIPFTGFTLNDDTVYADCGAALIDELVITTGKVLNIDEKTNNIIFPNDITKIVSLGYSSIKELVVPDTLIEMNKDALINCRNIETLVLPFLGKNIDSPDTITYLSEKIHENPIKNITITLQDVIAESAFYGVLAETITYEQEVKSIGNYAFYDCYNLKEFELTESLNSIGDFAFCGCKAFTEFNIPSSITEIPAGLIALCRNITEIEIPSSIKKIGENAFEQVSLTNFTIPNTVETIERGILTNCYSLVNLITPFLGSNIDDSENARLNYFGIYDSSIGTEFKIKTVYVTNAKYLTAEAFASYYTLEQVSIEGTIKEIPYSTFIYCINLNYVNMSDSITIIGNNAFNYCQSLPMIDLSENLEIIESYAFSSCDNLRYIDIYDKLKTVGRGAFEYTEIEVVRYSGKTYHWTKIDFENLTANPLYANGTLSYKGSYYFYTTIISKEKIGSYALVGLDTTKLYFLGQSHEFSSLEIGLGNDIISSRIYYYMEEAPMEIDVYWHFNDAGIEAIIWK